LENNTIVKMSTVTEEKAKAIFKELGELKKLKWDFIDSDNIPAMRAIQKEIEGSLWKLEGIPFDIIERCKQHARYEPYYRD